MWGQKVSWAVDKNATYVAGQELSSNTDLASVQLGNGTWTYRNDKRAGLISDYATFDEDGKPNGGSYLTINSQKDIKFVLSTVSYDNYTSNLVEASDPKTNLGYGRKKGWATITFDLKAGKTYYFYGNGYKQTDDNAAFTKIEITSYEKYTISRQLSDGTKIADDIEQVGEYGTTITATEENLQPIEYNGKNYVYESGNEEIVLDGTKTITLIYKPADLSSYTIKYLDEESNEIKSSANIEAPIGAKLSAQETDLVTFYSSDESKKYVYDSGNNEITISNDATQNVISLIFKTYNKVNYQIVAKSGDGNVGVITSGETYNDWVGKTYISKYWENNGIWYQVDQPCSVNIDAETIGVDVSRSDIQYFFEAENMSWNVGASSDVALSNGAYSAISGSKISSIGELSPGTYSISAYLVANGNRGIYVRNTDITDNSSNEIVRLNMDRSSKASEYSVNFTLDNNTNIGISGYTNSSAKLNQSADFDYVYIKALSIPASISAAQYATYIPSYNVVAPTDVKAYTVKVNAEKNGIELNEITDGTVIKAGTPILLNAEEGSYDFAVSSDDAADIADNDLVAATADVIATGNEYALTKKNGVVGFAPVKTDVIIPAGKAYLQVDNADAAAKFLTIGTETTGINAVESADKANNDAYYTLQGVKTTKPAAKGIYILNGKKVVVNK